MTDDATDHEGAGLDVSALLARVVRARREGRVPSMVVSVLVDGEVAWSTGVGSLDGRDAAMPTVDTSYQIGSITKSLVAAVVHQLAGEGRLSLDDAARDHADLPATVGDLRLGELLAHGSGLRAETSSPWWERTPGRSPEDLWGDLDTVDRARPAARGALHYSNVGYALLGRVVEEVDGRSWFEAVRSRILDPAGMTRTVLALPGMDLASAAAADPATWAGLDAAVPLAVHPDRSALLVEPVHDYGVMAPAGQLWSTASDLARWARALSGRAPDVLASAVVEAMGRPRLVDVLASSTAFGAGVQVCVHGDLVLVGHGGSVPGFVAGVLVAPSTGVGVVALANSTAGFGGRLVLDLLDLVGGVTPGEEERDDRAGDLADEGAAAPDSQGELVGTWYWGPRCVSVRPRDHGDLTMDLGSGPRRSRLVHVARDRWLGRDAYFDGEEVAVVRDDDGVVTHLEVASLVLTRRPYDPPEAVPGGIGHGWQPAPGIEA